MKKTILFLALLYSGLLLGQSTITYTQTNWAGGPDQEYFTDETAFFSSYLTDYSSVAGQISIDFSENNNVYRVTQFKGKILTSATNGIMAFDTLTKTWDYLHTSMFLGHHVVLHDTLFLMDGANVFAYDGTTNDYGFGPNGFMVHSSYANIGATSYYGLMAIGDDLYIGARINYNGIVLKYNNTTKAWEQMGSSFAYGTIKLIEYNGSLYAATHWYSDIYKWDGTSWNYFYSLGIMTASDFEIYDGKLFVSGYSTSSTTGKIAVYDGTSWNTIYSGHAVYDMVSLGDYLYFSVRKSSPPGSIYRYDGSTYVEAYPLLSENYCDNLLALDGHLYYGGNNAYAGTAQAALYKDGAVFYKLHVRYLNSSTFTTTDGEWGTLSYDATTPANTGIKLFVIGKEAGQNWNVNRYYVETPNNTSIQPTDDELRYRAILWSTEQGITPVLEEVRLQAAGSLSTTNLDTDNQLYIYPNPNNGQFHVQLPADFGTTAELKVFNIAGQVIHCRDINLTQTGETLDFALQNIPAGFYILELSSENKKIHKNFSIQ